jgi:hypothetical protein
MGIQLTVEDQPDLTIPEDTIVRARLDEIKVRGFDWVDRKVTPPQQKHSEVLEWWFEVTEGEYKSRKVKGQTDVRVSNHPRNKFRVWAEALLQRTLPVGTAIDTDDVVGLIADLNIRHRPDKKDASKIYEEVDEVMPINGGAGWSDEPPF